MASGSEYTVKIIIDSKDQTSGPAGKATKSLGNLQTAAKLAAGAFVALKGAQKAVDFVKLGASIQATEDRFYKFVGNAAEADKMLRALGDASDHTMTRMGKLDTASQLFSLGLATTADEMEIAGGMIGKLGKASLSTEGRMNSLTMLLANQSTRRLDDFSLSVEEVTARQRDLEAQGLSTEQAFKTAVYDIATKKIITLGDTSQLAATKIAKTEASLTDTKNALAEMTTAVLNASGALDKTATWATNTADAANAIRDHGFSLKAWADGVFTFIKTSGDGEQAIAAFTEEVSKAEPVNERLRQATMVANDAFEEWQTEARLAAEATVNMSTAVENLDLGTVDFIDDLTEAESTLAMYAGVTNIVTEAMRAQEQATKDTTLAQLDMSQALADASSAQIAQVALTELKTAYDEGKITLGQYTTAVQDTQLQFGLATGKSIALSTGVLELTSSLIDGSTKAGDFAVKLGTMIGEADRGVLVANRLRDALNGIPRNVNVSVNVQEGIARRESDLTSPGQQMASGGYSSGGMAMVGELGPEMVRLPRGSHVTPASQVNDNRTYHFDQVVNTRATTHNLMNDFALAQAMAG